MSWFQRFGCLIVIGMIGFGLASGTVLAQSASPTAASGRAGDIHNGACDRLAPTAAYPLTAVLPEAVAATPVGSLPPMAARHAVELSVSTLPVRLDALLAEPFAIVIHQRDQDASPPIACGEIAGVVLPHRQSGMPAGLIVPLREQADSGFAGMALVQPNNDGTTTITLLLAQGLVGRGPRAGATAATPAP